MKLKQEQLEQLLAVLLKYQTKLNVKYDQLNALAIELIKEGYGNISEYEDEIEQLNKDLTRQVKLTRNANASCSGAERNMFRYQCKAGRLEIKNSEIEDENKRLVKYIVKWKADYANLKEEFEQYKATSKEEIKKQRKQARKEVLLSLKPLLEGYTDKNTGESLYTYTCKLFDVEE